MNPGKEREVWKLLYAWRRTARKIAGEQWRLFFQGEGFQKMYCNPDEDGLAAIAGSKARVQMVRHQTVGTLKSFIENRQKEFVRRVKNMRLNECRQPWLTSRLKHEMLFINKWQAWFKKDLPPMVDGEEVSPLAREAARWLMRDILLRHNKPSFSRVNMIIDAREVEISEAVDPVLWHEQEAARKAALREERARQKAERKAAQAAGKPLPKKETREKKPKEGPTIRPPREGRTKPTLFPIWVRISTMTPGHKITIPLLTYERFTQRKGQRKLSIQINAKDGELFFGIITDIRPAAEEKKAEYQVKEKEIALDWGMRSLFGTGLGDLLGRGFLDHLMVIDARVTRLAAYRQKHGLKVRSRRYEREVERLRGFLRSTIGRVLNQLVDTHHPERIIIERLDFRSPELSPRMNRLVTNAGRALVKAKLQDLHERFGIEIVEVPAAYSSQECSNCGYVDAKNRNGEAFHCLWCGIKLHADVNAPRNLKTRRTRTFRSAEGEDEISGWPSKDDVLFTLVQEFLRQGEERCWQGRRGTSRDPRLENPYFKTKVASRGDLKLLCCYARRSGVCSKAIVPSTGRILYVL